MMNINDMLNEVIKTINNKKKDAVDRLLKMNDNYDEYLLFGDKPKFNKTKKEIYQQLNIYHMNSLIIYMLCKIKRFKKDIPQNIQLSYNCYYDGNETLYYDDNIYKYSNEEFTQILLNHIFHYFCNFNVVNANEEKQKSYILLCFDCAGFVDGITYSQSVRSNLYQMHKNKINNLILFKCINKNPKTMFTVTKDLCYKIHITRTYISFSNESLTSNQRLDIKHFLAYHLNVKDHLFNKYFVIAKYRDLK